MVAIPADDGPARRTGGVLLWIIIILEWRLLMNGHVSHPELGATYARAQTGWKSLLCADGSVGSVVVLPGRLAISRPGSAILVSADLRLGASNEKVCRMSEQLV